MPDADTLSQWKDIAIIASPVVALIGIIVASYLNIRSNRAKVDKSDFVELSDKVDKLFVRLRKAEFLFVHRNLEGEYDPDEGFKLKIKI